MTIDSIMHPSTATDRQKKAALAMTLAVCEAIRTAKRVPSGVLYSMLCGRMDLATYQAMIRTIKNTGLVREEAHELIWIGPDFEESR